MRLPQTPTPCHGNTPDTPRATVYSSFEGDEEFAIGWECANPSLQIETWMEEACLEAS